MPGGGCGAGARGSRRREPAEAPPASRSHLPKDKLYPVPFAPGEVLTYTVSWLKIEGGEMSLTTSREETPDGVPVHRITLVASSNDYVSKF